MEELIKWGGKIRLMGAWCRNGRHGNRGKKLCIDPECLNSPSFQTGTERISSYLENLILIPEVIHLVSSLFSSESPSFM